MNMLSIISLTFKNFEELKATYDSIYNLKDINFEWVVIDGGFCEKTAAFVQSISDLKVTYIREKDEGIYDAFNKGVKNSEGDYVVYLNSGDVLIDQQYLSDAINLLSSDPDVSFCHSNIIFHDEIAGKLKFKHKERSLAAGMPFYHQTLIVKKTVFETIGFFDTSFRIAGDYDWVMRMLKSDHKGHHFDCESVLMDGRGVSSTHELKSIQECKRSLKSNEMLSFSNFIHINTRLTKYLLRKIAMMLGFQFLLMLFKKIKYKSLH